jgi:Uma2 family endonuclease
MFTVTPKKFTLEEYHRLGESGFFKPDEQVELIRGEIIRMPFKKTSHSVCNSNLWKQVYKLIGEQAEVRVQELIILPADSEPQPDLVIARRKEDNYFSSHPYPQDILLVCEVSDSTLSYDQDRKLSLYGEDGISDYWIFNLIENHLETYSEPFQDTPGNFNYRVKRIFLPNEVVSIPGFSGSFLDLSLVFPVF